MSICSLEKRNRFAGVSNGRKIEKKYAGGEGLRRGPEKLLTEQTLCHALKSLDIALQPAARVIPLRGIAISPQRARSYLILRA